MADEIRALPGGTYSCRQTVSVQRKCTDGVDFCNCGLLGDGYVAISEASAFRLHLTLDNSPPSRQVVARVLALGSLVFRRL